MDQVMKQLVKVRYLGIPPAVASQLIQPEDQPEGGAIEVPPISEPSSDKALIRAIFLSTDPAVLSYNLKGKAAESQMRKNWILLKLPRFGMTWPN